MKNSLFLVALLANSALRLHAVDNVTLTAPLANIASTANTPLAPINLRSHFEVSGVTGAGVRFDTVLGSFTVDTFDSLAPSTVYNFLRYVNESRFTNSFIHRSDSTFNVIQGGTFLAGLTAPPTPAFLQITPLRNCTTRTGNSLVTCQSTAPAAVGMTIAASSLSGGTTIVGIVNATTLAISQPAIANGTFDQLTLAYPPIAMEAASTAPNNRGTIAMARQGGNLNSATSGWFINTADNPGFEPASALSGNSYCVFGQVIGTGMNVVDAIRARPIIDFGFPLLIPYVGTLPAPDTIGLSNLVTVQSMRQVFPTANGQNSFVQFTLTNTNPALVSASLSGSALNMSLLPNRGGTARLSIAATDREGVAVNTSFDLTVTGGFPSAGIIRDLNRDGFTDLIFQNNVGQLVQWFLDGTGTAVNFSTGAGLKPGSGYLYAAGLGDWKLVGGPDMNGDGFTDLLFQNAVGQIAIWLLDGSATPVNFSTGAGLKPGSGYFYTGALGDWKVVAVADINSDGFADLVFQNSVGQLAVWMLDGTGTQVNFSTGAGLRPGSGTLYSTGLGDWRVVGINDINSNGFPDLVFQNSVGQIVVWSLNGTGAAVNFSTGAGLSPGSGYLYSGALGDWRVARISDTNSDGFPDLIFQNSVGEVAVWLLDGTGTAVNFSTGAGLKPNSGYLYSAGLGVWRLR